MAVPTGTFSRHAAVGAREALADMIYDISPTDTPFLSNVSHSSADSVLVEFQTDDLASATNQLVLEGDDATTDTAIATNRLANYMQIMDKVPRVTGTLQASNMAGKRNEMSTQVIKRGRELKRDMETALTSNAAADNGSALTPRALAGVGTWLWDNQVKKGAATTLAVTSGAPTTAPTAGTAGTFSEADLKAAIKTAWDNGGDPSIVMVGSFNKQLASTFSGIGTQYRNVQPTATAPGTIVGAADLFISDFGSHEIVANRFQPAGNVHILDLEYWEVSYLREIGEKELAKTGDSERKQILTEFTLKALEPKSSAKVYTVTTS